MKKALVIGNAGEDNTTNWLVGERASAADKLLFEPRGFVRLYFLYSLPHHPLTISLLEPYVRNVGSARYRVILHLATAVRRSARTCLVARVCTTTCSI